MCASRLLGMGSDSLLMQKGGGAGVADVDRLLLLAYMGGCLTIFKRCLSCKLLTAKTQNVRGASRQTVSMGTFLTICQPGLSCLHLVDGCGCNLGLCSGKEAIVELGVQLELMA